MKRTCPFLLLPWLALMGACQPDELDSSPAAAGTASPILSSSDPRAEPDAGSAGELADALDAPTPPELQIMASPGTLTLTWESPIDQHNVHVFRRDVALAGETRLFDSDDSQMRSLHLPSDAPGTAWHRQQYRVEICDADDCLSSPWQALWGLADRTSRFLSPAVSLEGERYADTLAINPTANVAVIALPRQAALEIRARIDAEWRVLQRLHLSDTTLSDTRTMPLSISHDGDTVAVMLNEPADDVAREVRILHRLGESWQQTARWQIASDTRLPDSEQADASPRVSATASLRLSANGTSLLARFGNQLIRYDEGIDGWSASPLWSPRHTRYATELSAMIETSEAGRLADSFENHDRALLADVSLPHLLAVAANDTLDSMVILTRSASGFSLQHGAADAGTPMQWQSLHSAMLTDLDIARDVHLHLDAAGTRLAISGWESGPASGQAPIMVRHAMPQEQYGAEYPAELMLLDSLRAPPAPDPQARLTVSADATLSLIALGWHLPRDSDSGRQTDALVSTWRHHALSGLWLPALELPADVPLLAKQSFARAMALSRDGSTLMLSAQDPASRRRDTGAILVLR